MNRNLVIVLLLIFFVSILTFLMINSPSVDNLDKGCSSCKGPKAFNSKIEKLVQ